MKTSSPLEGSDQFGFNHAQYGAQKYYTELNRISTFLLVGVLAAMTFLLTVGYQHPHKQFSWALYSALIVLPLNLILNVVAHPFVVKLDAARWAEVGDEKDAAEKKAKAIKKAEKNLAVIRGVQQVLFVVGVVAVAAVGLTAAQFFFGLSTAASSGASAQ